MLFIPRALLKQIADAAERAYPAEACGLLAGQVEQNGDLVVTRVVESENLAKEKGNDVFELDPKVRFDLMRALEGGPSRILGLFHSHPDHPAQPSARDLELAWEPELIWLITAVEAGQAIQTTAHVLDPGGQQFREIGLRTSDWQPYPSRDALSWTQKKS
ncbi:MAG: Mov34/MPN/PAD-1 family protein [Magnetovibrionaceae bacterium]